MPFALGGQPYYVAYNSLTGARNIDRINAAGNGAATLQGGSWTVGWTQLVPFTLGGVQYFITYRGSTGEVKIHKFTGSGNSVATTTVWQGTWATRITHIVPMTHGSTVRLLRYSQATGAVTFDKVNANGLGIQNVGAANWTTQWSTLSPYTCQRRRPRAGLQDDRPGEDPQAQRRRQRHVDALDAGLDARARVALGGSA